MKYKVGDEVIVKPIDWYYRNKNWNGNIDKDNLYVFTKLHSKFCGKTLTIEKIERDHYIIKSIPLRWTDNMFIGLKEDKLKGLKEERKIKTMNKPLVLVVTESNKEILEDFSDILKDSRYNILVRYMEDDEFNLMFNIDCENINVDMSDEVFMTIAKMAHENDITINQQIMEILKEQIKKEEKKD
jgi:hypothetical protein